jgi:hypothetical protein
MDPRNQQLLVRHFWSKAEELRMTMRNNFKLILFALCFGVVFAASTSWAGETPGVPKIWRDPGNVEKLDFQYGPGGSQNAPKPPFTFVAEDTSGSNPKVTVKDAAGREWQVKWGTEVNAEVFASRIAWAAGYVVMPMYYVAGGKFEGVKDIHRADSFVDDQGNFQPARFKLKQKKMAEFWGPHSWRWDQNPFLGTKELNGLKVVMMLVSNWDSKDARDAERGSNTLILKSSGANEDWYAVDDWGGSMGKTGGVMKREKWDCAGYEKETEGFVKKTEKDAEVEFDYKGQHTDSISDDIKVSDVKWVMGYLGRITDAEIQAGLKGAGATPEEVSCFTSAIRKRLQMLQTASQ